MTSAAPSFVWVILAAGGSTRLGEPKQLLSLGGETLIEHQLKTLLATDLPVCVVTGAVDLTEHVGWAQHAPAAQQLPWVSAQQIQHVGLKPNPQIIHNPNWENGMGASVMLAQQHYPHSHIGWVLVDQYAITTEQALAFYRHWQQHPSPALVSRYCAEKGAWGVPTITHKDLMAKAELPERGLKPWLLANHHHIDLQFYDWPQALADLDTPAQWQAIQHKESWFDHT